MNQRTDLSAIADLIELCFSDHMDSEGTEFVLYLRRLAKNNQNRLSFSEMELPPSTMSGLVWVEGSRLIGNLSMIPFQNEGNQLMLIANVAVHPDFRHRGIGRELTMQALDEARRQKMQSVWLHVRDDNAVAAHLYESLGFVKRVLRATWQIDSRKFVPSQPESGFQIQRRSPKEWVFQRAWLQNAYPKEVIWNLPLRTNQFSPGFWNSFSRFFDDKTIEHWSLHQNGKLLGTLTWEETLRNYDMLWLAADPVSEGDVIRNLIPTALEQIGGQKPLSLNYPAGNSEQTFIDVGFKKLHNLIWMENPISYETVLP